MRQIYRILRRKKKNKKYIKDIKKKNLFDENKYNKIKNSDTIFIFGSATTLNDITEEQWNIIKKYDSMAINRFCFHHFIPKFYWMEVDYNIPAQHYVFEEITKKYKNKECHFIFNYRNFKKSNLLVSTLPEPIRSSFSFVIPKRYKYKWLYIYDLKKLKNKRNIFENVIHVRGSLATCVQLAYTMGYKNIILAGFSLKNQKYFYQKYKSSNIRRMEQMHSIEEQYVRYLLDGKQVHRTVRKDISEEQNIPSIIEILKTINNTILKKNNVNLMVYDEDSMLRDHFKIIKKIDDI